MRDSQRQKVYTAERVLCRYETKYPTVKDIERYCKKIIRSTWFIRHFGNHSFRVHDGRGRRNAGGWHGWGGLEITLPLWARCDRVILHELCHGLTINPPHGWSFAKHYMELVRHFMGKDAYKALKAAYKEHHVRTRPKGTRVISPEARQKGIEALRLYRERKAASMRQEGNDYQI